MRLQKTATGTTGVTKYSLHGKNIVHLTNAKNNLHFFYDARNKPAVVTFNGTAYAYLYNLQGDVIALIDSNGKKVVEYKYDAWGRILSKTGTMASTLGTLNPFRYRGYVYDEETGLYYLHSRYYNPEWGRFVNADANLNNSYVLFPSNQFCYCLNNPIMGIDFDGYAVSFGYFHRKVQEHFRDNNPGVYMEVGFYKYGNSEKRGRADLVNFSTGEVWEVKPHMASYFRNPTKYTILAQVQLESYIEGELTSGQTRHELNASLQPGGAVACTSFSDEMTDMMITYWSTGDGIIWYTTTKKTYWCPAPAFSDAREPSSSKQYSSQPNALGIAGVVLGGIVAGMAWLVGLPIPNFAY